MTKMLAVPRKNCEIGKLWLKHLKTLSILLFICHHSQITGVALYQRGSECTNNDQCDNSRFLKCIENSCDCMEKEGLTWDSRENSCMIMEGYPCGINQASPECITNSSCVSGLCRCDDEFLRDGFGLCRLSYGIPCSNEDKCSERFLLQCSQDSGFFTCKCQGEGEEYVWNEDRQKCVSLAGGYCDTPRDAGFGKDDQLECIEHAECTSSGVCECKPGFTQTPKGTCLLEYNQKCNNSEGKFCNDYAFLNCQDGTCACQFYAQMAYDNEVNQCRWLVGEDCYVVGVESGLDHETTARFFHDRKCVKDAFCKPRHNSSYGAGTCVCMSGFETSANKTCSKYNKGYGHECSASMDCDRSLFLECVPNPELGGRCECLQNEMYFDGNNCRVYPGKSCTKNKLCAFNAYCEGDWCLCNEGYKIGTQECTRIVSEPKPHGTQQNLYPRIPSLDQSNLQGELNPSKFACTELLFGTLEWLQCQCKLTMNSHEWSFEKSACLALVGSSCEKDVDCTENAFCDIDGRTCQCSSAAHTTSNRTCVLKPLTTKPNYDRHHQNHINLFHGCTEKMHTLKSIRVEDNEEDTVFTNGAGILWKFDLFNLCCLIWAILLLETRAVIIQYSDLIS